MHEVNLDGGLQFWTEGRGWWPLDQRFQQEAKRLLNHANPAVATTRAAAIALRATASSKDQIDLTWTPLSGVQTYRVELGSDDDEFHEAIEVEADNTSASLVGLEDAQADQRIRIRVQGLDKQERSLGVSNVCVVRNPTSQPSR